MALCPALQTAGVLGGLAAGRSLLFVQHLLKEGSSGSHFVFANSFDTI